MHNTNNYIYFVTHRSTFLQRSWRLEVH